MKWIPGLALLLLTACTDPREPLAPDFGNAVNANIAAQIVNPMPAAGPLPATDGHHVANALDRYQTDKVYRPRLPLESGRVNAPEPMEPQEPPAER